MTTLNAVLPLFAMIGLGFLAARMRLLNEAAIQGLVNYIFFFAIPPMLIVMLSKADPEKLLAGGPFLLAMFSTELVVALLATFWARWAYGNVGPAAYGILGFSACFSNGVLLAVPLVVAAFGPEAAAPALVLVTLDILLFVAVTGLLEYGQMGGRAAMSGAAKAAALNPVIVGTIVGLALAFTDSTLPGPLDALVKFLGPAAPPTALFALGATLALRPVSAASAKPAGVLTILKLFVQPALAALILFSIPGIDPIWRAAGIVYAAAPIGLNAYLFARRYEVGVSPVSTAIVVSTALSVITLSALLIWFGDRV